MSKPMSNRPRRQTPQPRRTHELLTLLDSSPHGATEALLVRTYGFTSDMILSLIGAGLASADRESVNAGATASVRLRITAAGRQAIEG
jgi:hypothetical protein